MAKESRINARIQKNATTTVSILHITTKPVLVAMITSLMTVIFIMTAWDILFPVRVLLVIWCVLIN